MNTWVSILLITLCAVCWDIGVVLQKKAADALPPITFSRDLIRVLGAFLSNRQWMGGLIVSGAGWGLFALALTGTPVSIARSIQGSGFVILAIFSVFFLEHPLKVREWLGVAVVTAGIVAVGLSEHGANPSASVIEPFRLVLGVGFGFGICLLVYGVRRMFGFGFDWVVVFSVIAGIFLGTGDVLTKGIIIELKENSYVGAFCVIGPALVLFYLAGQFLLSRAYQHGRAILVTAVSDFCARLVTIGIGVFAMGEFFSTEPLYRSLRIAGLSAILLGSLELSRFSGEQLAAGLVKESAAETKPE